MKHSMRSARTAEIPTRPPAAAASAGRMARPPGRQAEPGSSSAAPIVRAPRRVLRVAIDVANPTAAWLMRSTPPARRGRQGLARLWLLLGEDWLPAQHHPPGCSATLGITSRAQPCHTTTTGGKSRSPLYLLSLDLCVYVRLSRAAGRDTANRAV